MKLVKMREFGQCGAACLATVLGVSLDDALALVAPEYVGTTSKTLLRALRESGYSDAAEICTDAPDPFPPAILTVPSLNHAGLLHFLVWDGEQVLDPTCDEKRWPEDGPVFNGEKMPVQWACAILIGNRGACGVEVDDD